MKQPESAVILVRPRETSLRTMVMLSERRDRPGMWSLTGGKSHPDEWVWDTACRELREESGLILRPEHLRLFYAHRHEGRFVHFFALSDWTAMPFGFQPVPGPGEPRCRWGEISELFNRRINPFADFYQHALASERRAA